MSLFLIPLDQFYCSSKVSNINENTFKYSLNQKFRNLHKEDSCSEDKFLKQTNLLPGLSFISEQKQITMISEIGYQLKALFSIITNLKQASISVQIDILQENNNYYKPENSFQLTHIYHNFISLHSRFKNILFCLKLNSQNRQIKIQLPFYLNYKWADIRNSSKIIESVSSIFRILIKPHINLVQLSLKNILKQQRRGRSGDNLFLKPNKNIQILKAYTAISYLTSHLTNQAIIDNDFNERNQKRQRQMLDKILNNKQFLQPQFLKNNFLFNLVVNQQESNYQNYMFEQLVFNKDRKTNIYIPLPPQNKNPEQNFLVYNRIELKQINQQKLQKISQGGFADIFLIQISYWYPSPDLKVQKEKTQKNLIKDRVVVKRQISADQLFHTSSQSKYKSRKDHQIMIIKKLKKAKSIFLPKYYFPINTKNISISLFSNSILIQYIPFKTLAQLLQNNFRQLSLHSKLKLMLNICQALRYLRDFNIVHLDIKPNNILTYYNQYIKLIDFGQSYHPDVCMNGYKPGFTINYSPPQIFNEAIKSFNSKSDIFSMGVVFNQILFNEFPFQIYKSTAQYNNQLEKNLQQGWYYTPQLKQSYGDSQILRILINLISRCLSFNQEQRPQLDWIALILKLMLQIVP